MRAIRWSARAREDYFSILSYIADDSPAAAESVQARFDAAVSDLGDMPTGRRSRVSGAYEKVLTGLPYIIAYDLEESLGDGPALVVLRIIHGARDWPEGGWPA